MGGTNDYYFSAGTIKGLGQVFFLKVPQEAPPGSAPRRLLGSFVDEIDYGLFGAKKAPGVDHSWDPEYFLTIAKALPGWSARQLELETDLAGFTSSYQVGTKAGANANANFPGAPASGGIAIDYQHLRQATVTMGPGSKKLYVPDGYIPAAYKKFAANRSAYDDILFSDKNMLVNQIVIVTNLTIDVDSNSDFSADLDAKAAQANAASADIKYERKSDRKYSLSIKDGKEYLFAIGAVDAHKMK